VIFDECFRHQAGKPSDGPIAPDMGFLLKSMLGFDTRDFVPAEEMTNGKMTDRWQRAFLKLLRDHERLGIQLSQEMLNRAADELERVWWPEVGRPARTTPKFLRYYVDLFEALNRERGVDRPRTTALEEAKEFFRYRSVESVRKAMQPSRHRRPKLPAEVRRTGGHR
jgi:hypothetical protein